MWMAGKKLNRSLGKFGGSHIDANDAVLCPSAMAVLTKPHPDVEPEIFTILDAGIVWVLEEFGLVYFSGLHFHGGSEPTYKNKTTSSEIYYRLTLICYPPGHSLDGNAGEAFAALPGKKNNLLRIGIEMRNPT